MSFAINSGTAIVPSDSDPSAQPTFVRKVLFGADGLRAGWSLLLFVVLFAALMVAASFITHLVYHPDKTAGTGGIKEVGILSTLIDALVPLCGVFAATFLMSRIENRQLSAYGLGGSRKLWNFSTGLGWGVTCLSFLILILVKAGFLVIDTRLLFASDIFRTGSIWLVAFVAVASVEEYLFRGYLLFTLARGLSGIYTAIFKTRYSHALGFWSAAFVLALLFGLSHSAKPGESPIGLLSACLASLVFCLSLWRTGSLWWAIGFHATWDWAQSFLYGVADSGTMIRHHLLATHPAGPRILSGGATGPEGSVFILAVLAIISAVIIFTLPARPDIETQGYTT